MKQRCSKALKDHRLLFENIYTMATYRRITLIISGLSESQPDLEQLIKGPPKDIAIDKSNNFTQAALGFAKKIILIQTNYHFKR